MASLTRTMFAVLPSLSQQCRTMAGHSKWSNIRHIKGAKDAKFQKIASRIAGRIRTVIREVGSNDPKYNFMLARIIAEAKSLDIPKSTIENAIKGSSKGKDAGSTQFIEGKGVGNSFLIVETYTERSKHIRQQVQHVLKKFGGSIGQSGFASHSYENKGCVYVPVKPKEGDDQVQPDVADKLSAMTLDDAENIAIEVDSEAVQESYDEDGTHVFKFITDLKQLHSVKASIEALPLLSVSEARQEYVPVVFSHLETRAQLVGFAAMIEALRDVDDVIRVYHNIDNEADIDAAIEASQR